MTEKENTEKKDGDAILFNEVKVGDFVIKPWSFGKLFKVSVHLENILEAMEAKGMSIQNALSEGVTIDLITKLFVSLTASRELLEIVSITVDTPIEEIEELSVEEGVYLVSTIVSQNWDTIKNALAPLLGMQTEVGETKKKVGRPKKEKS